MCCAGGFLPVAGQKPKERKKKKKKKRRELAIVFCGCLTT
jgi:hypothetical protein